MKRARDIREQLAGLMERVEITLDTCGDDDVPLRKAITSGFFYNVGQLSKPTEGLYKTVKQRRDVYIHPGSGALTRLLLSPCSSLWMAGCTVCTANTRPSPHAHAHAPPRAKPHLRFLLQASSSRARRRCYQSTSYTMSSR